ncbi:hypothetical protein [Aquabacterium sp. OR-4]|uniref:hypothetical protein n=1 Tax=Aquabacterium sp. OR-4 TaxID=2978127 RepID=UPI0021B3E78A|nr:hypothetical protein [Aquabacterium sp. OR-4]MDT7837958.1 hypothetical protein [Aquabacterium sp. OR-4]
MSSPALALQASAHWPVPGPAPAAPGTAAAHAPAAWLDGLGRGEAASLHADLTPELRGLSVQQHAERVLAALIAG